MQFDGFYKNILNSLLCENSSLPQDVFFYPTLTSDPRTQRLYILKHRIPPILNDMVREHILVDIEALNSTDIQNTRRVMDYVLVGDCLKPFFTVKENAPLEVVIYFNFDECSDLLHSRLDNTLKNINGRLIPGTKRKIFYHLRNEPINLNNYHEVYHPFTNKWLKEPKDSLKI
jgi:hypothetical protein